MIDLIQSHHLIFAIAVYWTFSAAVSALPMPTPNGNKFYEWTYGFLHTIAGNLTTAIGSKLPAPPAGK